MSTERISYPSVAELRRLVKKRPRRRFSAMWFLEPIQVYFSYVLIRLGVGSLQVTVLWLLVAFAGYGVMAVGTPTAFISGCVLLFLQTILDGSDGEVARYRKQFVTEREDLESFIHGIYLDKVFHIIEKPLWGLALAFGLYRMTGEPWIFAAGVSLGIFQAFCRHNATLQKDIPREFAAKASKTLGAAEATNPAVTGIRNDPVLVRVMDKLFLFMRNGKLFNLLVLLSAVFDLAAGQVGYGTWAVLGFVVASAAFAPVMIVYVISRTVWTRSLIERARTG